MIKILADDRIPFVSELFGKWGELILKSGEHIKKHDLLDVSVLLTRSITSINSALLDGTSVKFVGSATAGFDHIDHALLEKQSITWAVATGANASAVAEYVLHCIAFLRKNNLLSREKITAAIVGVGWVGAAVSARLKNIGFTVFYNDPPRAELEKDFISMPLRSLTNVDLFCLHTPLIKSGKFPTYHLINEPLLKEMKPGIVLLNAGRGSVVDNSALLKQNHIISCIDVWENEPKINLELLKKVTIATPHIAGYSRSAKLQATISIYEAFLRHFHLSDTCQVKKLQRLQEKKMLNIDNCETIEDILLKIYNPANETKNMRELLLRNPSQFENLRRHYPLRDEYSVIQLIPPPNPTIKSILQRWGFRID
ncbi:4-phosphoerythronate dehydrogenase [Coxiella endosymbiont of Amblyomma nuttalli]|uniref:4-phosphoerythronate dehydrogenase n=1 Tax=Coxiella endosymbiont of Amblyomma nuttalli TaxID=2749996 RepID=UPI001BA65C4E|nr:4-phosphoerythronate dehydrogenase [Coxiella endosymbiont of Amblyomma nuttalli]QTS84205.1 Erythronate-4-phosphate dehydrogenase [Coxiella endosymbiont of Amblyomma nuttalli]